MTQHQQQVVTLKKLRMRNKLFIFILFFFIFACDRLNKISNSSHKTQQIRIASTTSLYDIGLLDVLTQHFYEKTNIKVNIIPVGTGKAFILAKRGDVDGIITHSPEHEIEFIKTGFGIERTTFLCTDFVLVGPVDDISAVRSAKDIKDAFKRIYTSGAKFISRSDSSGTHLRELIIWNELNLKPVDKKWYFETGQGMAQTLFIANELSGYCLTDRLTFLSLRKYLKRISILYEGKDELLKNFYSIIATNPKLTQRNNYKFVSLFINWLKNDESKNIIENFLNKWNTCLP